MNTPKDNPSTKEKLLDAGVKCFSRLGYEATTLRLIAETTDTNVASIAFHFGNKEEFYFAVLNYVAEKIREDYSFFINKVKTARKEKRLSPGQAWEFIKEYVDLLLSIVTDSNEKDNISNQDVLNLLFREQISPAKGIRPISIVLCKESEAIFNLLLMDLWENEDEKHASIISRSVTGAIISFGEHPTFIRRALGREEDAPLEDDVWDTLRYFMLSAIKNYYPF